MEIPVFQLNDANWTLQFSLDIWKHLSEPLIIFDFRQLRFAHPFPTLYFAEVLREFVAQRKSAGYETKILLSNPQSGAYHGAQSYLAHIGFFKYINIDLGNAPGMPTRNPRYTPITIISLDTLHSVQLHGTLLNSIQNESDRLAGIISSTEEQAIMMAYCFREIIRNVFEHSHCDSCVVMGQRWANDWAEISILDRGIGISRSLMTVNHNWTEAQALRQSLQPGVTRVDTRLSGENSGFGLWITSEIGRQLGQFLICSNQYAIGIDRAQQDRTMAANLSGTAVRLRLQTTQADYFPNLLQNIVLRGEEIFAINFGYPRNASRESRSPRL